MKKRFITLLVILPVGLIVIFAPVLNGLLVFIFMIIFAILLSLEVSNMLKKRGMDLNPWVLSIFSTLSNINFLLYALGSLNLFFFFIFTLLLLTLYLFVIFMQESVKGEFKHSLEIVSISLLVFIMTGVFLPIAGLLKIMSPNGWILVIPLAIAWFTDAGGLFIGKWLGRDELNMLSSPHKTVQGYIGSILFALITGVILFVLQILLPVSTSFTIWQLLLISFLLALASIIGDLAESTFKRWAGVKDSGQLFPGHGGVFDLIDSVIFSLPVYYILIKLMGY